MITYLKSFINVGELDGKAALDHICHSLKEEESLTLGKYGACINVSRYWAARDPEALDQWLQESHDIDAPENYLHGIKAVYAESMITLGLSTALKIFPIWRMIRRK